MLRYLLMLATHNAESHFHLGTIAVNVLGCLLLGSLVGVVDGGCQLNGGIHRFLVVGVCGGFTTFSTFVSDGFGLAHQGDTLHSMLYVCGSVLLGVVAFVTAYHVAGMLVRVVSN